MTASAAEMDRLARELWRQGVAAFCPTTLSVPAEELKGSVQRLGQWIQEKRKDRSWDGAIPLGIHLEGPFISAHACGAHPPSAIRPLSLEELEYLWESSLSTLKILTVAPEPLLEDAQLARQVRAFCKKNKIILSLGHSRATEEQATRAIQEIGFSGTTHAWNAMAFHQREPGILGATLGNPKVHVELILDQVHVCPTVVRWTRKLHGSAALCFVSDCVPPALGTRKTPSEPGPWSAFGPLQARFERGACRLDGGHLAGGGRLLTHAYLDWVETEAKRTGEPLPTLAKKTVRHLTTDPLKALGLKPSTLARRKLRWEAQPSRLQCRISD